jgi:hypothetical protein
MVGIDQRGVLLAAATAQRHQTGFDSGCGQQPTAVSAHCRMAAVPFSPLAATEGTRARSRSSWRICGMRRSIFDGMSSVTEIVSVLGLNSSPRRRAALHGWEVTSDTDSHQLSARLPDAAIRRRRSGDGPCRREEPAQSPRARPRATHPAGAGHRMPDPLLRTSVSQGWPASSASPRTARTAPCRLVVRKVVDAGLAGRRCYPVQAHGPRRRARAVRRSGMGRGNRSRVSGGCG